jgi:hypothetical protein
MHHYGAIFHDKHLIAPKQIIMRVSHHYDCLLLTQLFHTPFKDLLRDLRIQIGNGLVEKIDVSLRIDDSSQSYSCLFARRHVDPSLADHRHITIRQIFNIRA